MDLRSLIGLIAMVLLLCFTAFLYFKEHPIKGFSSSRTIAATACFGALSAILYAVPIFNFTLPFFPSFLSLHFDEIPSFIVGFAYGPYAAVGSILVKTIVKLPLTTTLGVGELGDFILSTIFVLPSTIIYRHKRNLKGVAIGFSVSLVLQLVASMVLNVYMLVPFYSNVMAGLSEETLLAICQLAMPWIKDVGWSYAFYAVLPFNLLKDAIVLVLTFLAYRYLHRFIKFSGQ